MRKSLFNLLFTVAAIFVLAGCASTGKPRAVQSINIPAAATKPAGKGDLPFEQIVADVTLPTATPATAATQPARPPLEAIDLFAQARAAMLQGQRFTAINLLEKAVKLDPESYQLRFWLGQAHTSGGLANEQSIAAYEAAAKIDPDHAIVHSELGRQYLSKGDTPKALQHLMLATQTSDYASDDSLAAVVDFYLAKALQHSGYDLAALQRYEKLIARLQAGGLSVRGSPELAYLVSQPDGLYAQVAELLQRRGRQDDAIKLYQLAMERKPTDFGYQAQLVRALAAAGRHEDATRQAAEVVRSFRASPDALALLKEIFQKSGGDAAVARELQRLHRERPYDRTILYALVDVLAAQGEPAQAKALLADAARETRYESELVRRLFRFYDDADEIDAAARLLIEALAARPNNTRDISPMWAELLRPWRRNHLTVARMQALEVGERAAAAKLFWLAELSRLWNREALERTSLEQSVKQVPPFAPAFRALMQNQFAREADPGKRQQAAQQLVASVERQGDEALAAELRGLALLAASNPTDASEQFAKAQQLGGESADLRLEYAAALNARGDTGRAEQVLWKLAEEQPTCEEAYMQLFRAHLQRSEQDKAIQVLKTWRTNDPLSTNAQIVEVTVLIQMQQPAAAEKSLDELFARDPDNGEVLSTMAAFYGQAGRIEEFIAKLEARRTEHPEHRTASEQLVLLYAAQKRLAEATRVLDAARASASNDPDLLYYIAGLYTRVGEKKTSEQILEQIIQIDPAHAPACNDLGYNWADQGKNLTRAESLCRTAVEKEPDNHSFLDSLGWVFYKRGRFEQARHALEDAITAASMPDPVVLDHLGDTLYRMNLKPEAAEQWKRSQARLPGESIERDELKQLRLQLQQKLKQSAAGQPVSVAPVAEEAAKTAKN
jgi:predicted Zn-dependent protease